MSIVCYSFQNYQRIFCPFPRIRRKHLLLFFVSFTLFYFVLRTNDGMIKEASGLFVEILNANSSMKLVPENIKDKITMERIKTEFASNIYNSSSNSIYLTQYTSYSFELVSNNDSYGLCPEIPPGLVGSMETPSHAAFHEENLLEIMDNIENENNDTFGGLWYPKNCQSIQNLALIIPYRNRSEHLAILLKQLHTILKRQLTYYQIIVVEQAGDKEFNKARLMNIAFDYINNSSSRSKFNCFIFHDVDLIPENDKNLYRCNEKYPIHLSPAVSSLKYRLPYDALIGGVLALTPKLFQQVNGYSNLYWGWGGEDDDMYYRMEAENLKVNRPSIEIGRYKMIKHSQRLGKKERFKLVWSAKNRYKHDGIAQLHTLNYTIEFINRNLLYTHIMIDLGLPPTD